MSGFARREEGFLGGGPSMNTPDGAGNREHSGASLAQLKGKQAPPPNFHLVSTGQDFPFMPPTHHEVFESLLFLDCGGLLDGGCL